MDYRILLATRLLFKRKGSLIASSLAVAVAIIVIVINSVIFNGVANAIIRDLIDFRFGHVYITDEKGNIDNPDRQLLGYLERLDYVEGATVRMQDSASINNTKNGVINRAYNVPLVGVIPQAELQATRIHYTVSEGEFVSTNGAIVLGSSVARDLDANVGDLVRVKMIDASGNEVLKWFTVSGISRTAGGLGFDTSSIVTIESLRDMVGVEDESSELIVRLTDERRANEFRDAFLTRFPNEDFEIQTIEEAGESILEGIRSGIAFINVVGYFGMMSSAFAIVTIMMMIVTSKTREIGIMRSIGSKKKDILVIFLFQGLIIGAIGAALGFTIGSGYALYAKYSNLQFGESLRLDVQYDPVLMLNTALTGLVMSLAASIYPALRATRLQPVEAIRYY